MIKQIFLIAATMIILALASCGKSLSYEQINEKIEAGKAQELSQTDISAMIEYVDNATDLIEVSNDPKKMMEINLKIEKEYPYVNTFSTTLTNLRSGMDESNRKKYLKTQQKAMDKMEQMFEANPGL